MKHSIRMFFGAAVTLCAAFLTTVPASAGVSVGISFGWDGPDYVPISDPCAYYDYYDAAPPWGLPPDYCDYPVYSGPVMWNGMWYRGPIYYRWERGVRLFWLNGGWHRNGWRGGPVPAVRWRGDDRGYRGDWRRIDGPRIDWPRGGGPRGSGHQDGWHRDGWRDGPDGRGPRNGWSDDRGDRRDRHDGRDKSHRERGHDDHRDHR